MPSDGPKRRGRRPKSLGNTRSLILRAAAGRFARAGFESTTLRAIAREAGVDPALVLHYFGSKERLFLEVIAQSIAPRIAGALEGGPGPASLGERGVRAFLARWDSPAEGIAFATMFRASLTNERIGAILREFIETEIVGRVAPRFDPRSRGLGFGLVASQLIGLGVARYVVRLGPVANATADELARAVGPTLTRYLEGPVGDPAPRPLRPSGRGRGPSTSPGRRTSRRTSATGPRGTRA
jgi:AcrR family transcriptional regulator